MEHKIIDAWRTRRALDFSSDKAEKLERYAGFLYEENRKYNLTGLKSLQDILQALVVDSIEPFIRKNVPRGTRIIDLGTGAGVPGIPLGIYFNPGEVVLLDSHGKKIEFVNQAITALGLENFKTICMRAEEAARMADYREAFDWVVTRAAGVLYVVLELSAPFAKPGGLVYVYARGGTAGLSPGVLAHAADVGLEAIPEAEYPGHGITGEGLAFVKTGATKNMYPRRYAIIKRGSEKTGA